jgi:hypothetical protein
MRNPQITAVAWVMPACAVAERPVQVLPPAMNGQPVQRPQTVGGCMSLRVARVHRGGIDQGAFA